MIAMWQTKTSCYAKDYKYTVYRKENLKCDKDKCHFRCTSVPLFGGILSRQDIVTQWDRGSTAPRYTGVMPATYAGPG